MIDPIHEAGGDVLKLIGDGVLAMFWGEDMADARRAALRAEHLFRKNVAALNERRAAEGRPTTSAYIGLHVGEVFYGNIGSEDRLDFTVVGPTVNEVSRIASMSRSVDRELLASSEFYKGLDAAGRRYLVSTGRYAPRNALVVSTAPPPHLPPCPAAGPVPLPVTAGSPAPARRITPRRDRGMPPRSRGRRRARPALNRAGGRRSS